MLGVMLPAGVATARSARVAGDGEGVLAGHLAVGVQDDATYPLRALERDWDVDHRVAVADRDRRGPERLDVAGLFADPVSHVGEQLD